MPPPPSCQVLGSLAPTERVTWLQFDLPMMKRGALLHWSLADNLIERQGAASTGSRHSLRVRAARTSSSYPY